MNLPIALTLFRIVLVPPIMVFLISSSRVSVLIAAVIFVTASLTDWLDGRMARRWNQVTKLGTLLDPVADKLLVAAALISLVHIDMISAWMAVVIIGRELAVTGLRGVALSMGVVVPASSLGKAKTVSQYVALTLLILEKGVSQDLALFHLVARSALWIALASHRGLGRRLLLPLLPPHQPEGPGPGSRAMALTVLGLLAAYLIGAIPIGFLVARAAGGTDIRRAGSGNIGATNVLRTLGTGPAVLTLVGDIVKGYVAVRVAALHRARGLGRGRRDGGRHRGQLLAGLPPVPGRQGRGHGTRRLPRAHPVGGGPGGAALDRGDRGVPLRVDGLRGGLPQPAGRCTGARATRATRSSRRWWRR